MNAVVEVEAASMVPAKSANPTAEVVAHAKTVQQVMQAVMKPNVHYGAIPGAGDKPGAPSQPVPMPPPNRADPAQAPVQVARPSSRGGDTVASVSAPENPAVYLLQAGAYRSPAEAESMLVLQRALYLKRGVFALVPRIAALELPRGRGIRVWVDWEERAQSPEESRCASTIYYLTAESAGLMIEMVQNLTLTMPEFRPHFASLALSA